MNYLKNKKRNLIRLTQGSILISSIAIPTITNTNSASAMFNTLARKTVASSSTTPNVRKLIGQFEKISSSTTSKSTLKRTTLGGNPGFNYMNPSSTSTLNKTSLQSKSNDRSTTSSSSGKQNLMSRLFSKISSSPKSSKSPLYTSTQQSLLKTSASESTSPSPTLPKKALLPPDYTQSTNTKPVDESAPSLPTTSKQALLPPTSSSSTQPRPTTKPPIAPKPNLMSNYQQSLSNKTTSSTSQSSTNTKPAPPKPKRQNLSTTIKASGFTYPYDDGPSSSKHEPQPIYDEVGVATSSSTSNNASTSTSTSPTDTPLYSSPYTYTLKIGEELGDEYNPYKLSSKQEGILESLIKTSVVTIVKNNLPEGFTQTHNIKLKFDPESGRYLNQALTSFLMRSAINTLNSIDSQQQ